MIDRYDPFFEKLHDTQLARWVDHLRPLTTAAMQPNAHGKMNEWQSAVSALPTLTPTTVDLTNGVTVDGVCTPDQRAHLIEQLQRLHPWRKGPFNLYGVDVDTEWRSDWKWERVRQAADLRGARVLDVGCGNGYHGWRMVGDGARQVIGIDPSLLFVMQFWALQKLIGTNHLPMVLPVGIESIPADSHAFDVVFSMGVLYHRRSPFDHLFDLRNALRPNGRLVLETLVIDGALGEVLVPEGRYAQMRNVWFLPSLLTLESWLRKCGFKQITLIDVTPTTVEEQRSTRWMTFHSLENYLKNGRTIEGHPPPLRATFAADLR